MSAISFLLIFFSGKSSWLDSLEGEASIIATPFYWVADLPSRFSGWLSTSTTSRFELTQHIESLEAEVLLLKAKNQRMAALAAENVRLRELLNSSALVDEKVRIAELVGVSPDPLHHEIIINKGANDGLYIGLPVLDAQGLMGQVIKVEAKQSRVLLITDATHAIPVIVNRNGVRSIAEGVGRLQELSLRFVAQSTDIKVGDLLVSSGMGGHFPAGYPVGVVASIQNDPGQPFLSVRLKPSAQLDRSRYVLLAFKRNARLPSSVDSTESP